MSNTGSTIDEESVPIKKTPCPVCNGTNLIVRTTYRHPTSEILSARIVCKACDTKGPWVDMVNNRNIGLAWLPWNDRLEISVGGASNAPSDDYDYSEYGNQLHAGTSSNDGHALWHTDSEGRYWCGQWHYRTPEELLLECQTTICDLIKNHPRLRRLPSMQVKS